MTTLHTATRILHEIPVDELTGAISVPIYQTSTFVQESPGVNKGYDYSRTSNPTRNALEKLTASLEGGTTGCAFSSGLAAIDAVLKLLKSGDEILAVDDIYGGAYRLFTHVYAKFGIRVTYVDTTSADEVARHLNPRVRLVWLETPTNPTLKISDIAAIAALAHANGSLLVVDNTFASPVLQQPLQLGADIVVHSATKYLGGHSDLIAGLVVTATEELGAQLKFIQNASGAVLGPWDSWLVIRGIETLPLRVERHASTAVEVACYLQQVPAIRNLYYPGLPGHVNHHIAARQQSAFGSVISFSLQNNTVAAAETLVTSTRLFHLAESLGGVKSLICHPAQMTHRSVPEDKRRAAGVADSLIRLSIGLEHPDDLIADLEQAFEALAQIHPQEPVQQHIHSTLNGTSHE